MTLADTWGIHEDQFWLRGQRPEQPVSYDASTGMWNVYGYSEVYEILSDPQTYSSNTQRITPKEFVEDYGDPEQLSAGSIVTMDPPQHSKLRKLVSRAFSPKVVADLEPRIAGLTNELLDAVSDRGRMELVADLAYPLPVIVIAELLGVPSSDRHLFKEWVDKMFTSTQKISFVDQSEEQKRGMEVAMEQNKKLTDYLGTHAAERRKQPREDLLTRLVEAEVDGERLSDLEVVNFANILLIAGHITTTMLLGNTVLCLDMHSEQRDRILADRSLLPSAIEESLRFLTPFAAAARVTNTDVELGGQSVPADQMLLVWIAAANRDANQFTDPDVFDPTRDPNPHVGFGRGIHFCVGAPLARLEGRIALNIVLDRYPNLRIDPDHTPEFIPAPTMTGVRKLPLLL